MTNPRWLALAAVALSLSVVGTQTPSSPIYRHTVYFPGYLGSSLEVGGSSKPVQFSGGFYLNRPPMLFPPLPPPFGLRAMQHGGKLIERFLQATRAAGNAFRPPPSAESLFRPNTVQQPAETVGQVKNYQKALEEQAREVERQENDITTAFTSSEIADLISERPKSFVDVKLNTGTDTNYKYVI